MPDWSLVGKAGRVKSYPTAAVGYWATIATSASSNTKGSWIEVCPAAPWNAVMQVSIGKFTYTGSAGLCLMDIAFGDAGSEIAVLNNLHVYRAAYGQLYTLPTMLFVPAGVRISARAQTPNAGNNVRVSISLTEVGGFDDQAYPQISDTYGANVSTSGGTVIDPGGSANTKGAWVQMTAGLTRNTRSMFLALSTANLTRSTSAWQVDIGIGAAGSEVVIVEDFALDCYTGNTEFMPNFSHLYPISLPAGTRVAVRASCLITGSPDRLFHAILYTFS